MTAGVIAADVLAFNAPAQRPLTAVLRSSLMAEIPHKFRIVCTPYPFDMFLVNAFSLPDTAGRSFNIIGAGTYRQFP